ncbi:MAG: cyclic nucleotide-binding domain-containing protein [Rhizobiaceae bacterium]|nr:cyclic nucleotide-binding domain-containing protein [Rhizobiaceae bacterium]
MALDDDIRILEQVTLLEGFSREQLRLLAFGAETMRLRAGRDLYQEGAAADCAYVVSAGTVELYRSRGSERVSVGEAGPGAILGELALISGGTRLTSAVAATDVEVIRLNRSLFRRILEEYPDIAAALHARITANMKAMLDDITRLGSKFG